MYYLLNLGVGSPKWFPGVKSQGVRSAEVPGRVCLLAYPVFGGHLHPWARGAFPGFIIVAQSLAAASHSAHGLHWAHLANEQPESPLQLCLPLPCNLTQSQALGTGAGASPGGRFSAS